MLGGIKVRCVYCKAERVIPFSEASRMTDMPMCDKDGGPMVAVEAGHQTKTPTVKRVPKQ